MTDKCKYENKNHTCGLKGSYAYRHKCFPLDLCRCHEPPTNADHIRSMSDEELARRNISETYESGCGYDYEEAPYETWTHMFQTSDKTLFYDEESAIEYELNWLRQPVKEGAE